MRDRLIELLNKKYDHFCDQCGINKDSHYAESLADYLLENGVIVPPCKVGDTVYVINRCSCRNPANYDLKQCHKKIVEKTPKVLARRMEQEMGRRINPNTWKVEYEVCPIGTVCYSIYEKQFTLKMLTEIGKTVFLTFEDAEKALKGGGEQ